MIRQRDTDPDQSTRDAARKAFVVALVVGGVVAGALLLWKLRLLVALLFLAFTIAAAMRPGVDALRSRGVPRPVGLALHYAALVALLAIVVSLVIPLATHELQSGVGDLPTSKSELEAAARSSTGFKQDVLEWLRRQLEEISSAGTLIHPALAITRRTVEVLLGTFFTLSCAAYWIFERDRAEELVLALLSPSRRSTVRGTWRLIDRKMGAYVRGLGLLILLVGAVLSIAFWLVGLPYALLLGMLAGLLETIPVIGPLVAGAIAVAVGLTVSWQVAVAAGLVVLVVRLIEDNFIVPRVIGEAVGLSPLVVLVSVFGVGLLFGGFAVLLAIPLAASMAILFEVLLRHRTQDLEEEEESVPARRARR